MISRILGTVTLTLVLSALPARSSVAGFIFDPIAEPILSASFSANFAALNAHRFVAGFEVNMLQLMSPKNKDILDLSEAFFGSSELLLGQAPKIDQGPLQTGVVSVDIPAAFLPVIEGGRVGVWFLATDTFDGVFALDYLSLSITTATGTTEVFIGGDDGFGIGLPSGADLPGPLPAVLPPGSSGTGFDELVSSKNHHNEVPQPGSLPLAIIGLVLLARLRRRSRADG